ncbi:flagellar basal-body rod protein FlgF [Candidatus Poribacteria bacterium]|nr:MAG: flagellar basal-body rod protein FlgF [Candidatus Poribacteria bacterium]
MIRGLYKAAQGMLYRQRKLDVIANNLANASSTGYKRSMVGFNAAYPTNFAPAPRLILASLPLRNADHMPELMIMRYGVDFSQGPIRETGNPLDFAINGRGFFVIQTPNGVRYTRDGRFALNANGELVTLNGDKVLGQNGPITIPKGGSIHVDKSGRIYVDGKYVDTLLIVDLPLSSLAKEGKVRFAAVGTTTPQPIPANAEVLQGFLEDSNVDIVREMVEMIETLRCYESYQKAIQAFDSTVQQLNEFAKA